MLMGVLQQSNGQYATTPSSVGFFFTLCESKFVKFRHFFVCGNFSIRKIFPRDSDLLALSGRFVKSAPLWALCAAPHTASSALGFHCFLLFFLPLASPTLCKLNIEGDQVHFEGMPLFDPKWKTKTS